MPCGKLHSATLNGSKECIIGVKKSQGTHEFSSLDPSVIQFAFSPKGAAHRDVAMWACWHLKGSVARRAAQRADSVPPLIGLEWRYPFQGRCV